MRLTVHDKLQLIDEAARGHIEARVFSGFSRFGRDVISVTVLVGDVNGPRGGVDKRCSVVLKLRKMCDVVVTVTDKTLSSSINRALRRGERVMDRRVRRRLERKKRQQSWNPRLGFEI